MNLLQNLQRKTSAHLLGALFLFFPLHIPSAQFLVPQNLFIDNRNGMMALHFDLDIQNKDHLKRALLKGENLHLTLHASLYKRRTLMWNKLLRKEKKAWLLSNNPVTQQVIVKQDKKTTLLTHDNFSQELASQLKDLEIFFVPWKTLQPDSEKYIVVLEIKMGRDRPIWVKLVDSFWQDELEQDIRYEIALQN